jgi:hypothetical protein
MSQKYDLQELASFIPYRDHHMPMIFEDEEITINLKELSNILWHNDVPQYDYHFIDAPILEAYTSGLGWCLQRIIDLGRQNTKETDNV